MTQLIQRLNIKSGLTSTHFLYEKIYAVYGPREFLLYTEIAKNHKKFYAMAIWTYQVYDGRVNVKPKVEMSEM